MARTKEQKEARLCALEEALDEGVKIVKYSDKTVEYRSVEEIERIIYRLKMELGIIKKTCRLKANFSKGLC